MKVLMLSTDERLFIKNSPVQRRLSQLGGICETLHIIVLTGKGYTETLIAPNVFLHPTNSSSKWRRLADAYRIGKNLSRPDLVSVQDPFETGVVGFRLSRMHRSKLELQVHTDFLGPYFKWQSPKNMARLLIARFLLPKADSIRVVSKRIKHSLQATSYKLQATPYVLPVFIDAEKIMSGAGAFSLRTRYPEFDFTVLTASRLEPEKNVALGILAMKEVIGAYPRTGYLIAGGGSERRRLEALATALSVDQNVIFLGYENDILPYYRSADLYLSTSNYEGYGLALLEAALSECPIVTTDVGVVGEVLRDGEGALVCLPRDPACLAKKIFQIMGDSELGKKLKRTALAEALRTAKDAAAYLAACKKTWEDILLERNF